MIDNNTFRLKASKAVGAMLGAAFGDALGWPNERISKSSTSKEAQGSLYEFNRWTRRSGGRFYPHEETIEAGEYSDDTQLMLCLSRSLQKGEAWWDHFTQVELPFWSVYERGGGGATKRAVESWLDGVTPWNLRRKPQDVERYYHAGGNGVAMRVLPHILHSGEKEFPLIATNIFLDGIATHGHPRALLGALAYGFSLWVAFRKDSKLAYGELVEELIKNVDLWSAFPATSSIPPDWTLRGEDNLHDYTGLWESAKVEIMEYLEVCRAELSKGALSLDDNVLRKLQCFNSKIGGAGSVAAIASVYLASRHAADPINGVVTAALAVGSDTDTIASMTGGLLACINGSDWLSPVKQGIQDAAYIEENAFQLVNGNIDEKPTFEVVGRSCLKNWIDDALTVPDSNEISLPDNRKAKVNSDDDYIGRSGKFKVEFRRLHTEDGQTIYLKKISKGKFEPLANNTARISLPRKQALLESRRCGSKIPVASFDKAIWFYRDCLGLTVKKRSSDLVVFDQGLVLVPISYMSSVMKGLQLRTMLYIEAANVSERFQLVEESELDVVSPLKPWGRSKLMHFRCLDPDGNIVEVFSCISA